MLANMTPEQLRQLFEAMMTGQNMSREQMADAEQSTSPGQMTSPYYQPGWRGGLCASGFDRLIFRCKS
jgi:hypothetical protein